VRLMEQNNIETTRYINANFVQGSDGTPRRYIASQGPLPNTVDAFWRMVWEKDARVLVMVTGLKEKGKHKCARYWPKTLWNPDLNVGDVKYGDISLRIMAGFRKEGFVTSKFEVRKGDVVREVWHFWCVPPSLLLSFSLRLCTVLIIASRDEMLTMTSRCADYQVRQLARPRGAPQSQTSHCHAAGRTQV
jgi:hypothetical protein